MVPVMAEGSNPHLDWRQALLSSEKLSIERDEIQRKRSLGFFILTLSKPGRWFDLGYLIYIFVEMYRSSS